MRSCSPTASSPSSSTIKAKEWLGQKGYDPAYGARPLKRVIQKYVQDPLADPAEVAHTVVHGHHANRREGLIEVGEAVLLAIVAVATAWSGYQTGK